MYAQTTVHDNKVNHYLNDCVHKYSLQNVKQLCMGCHKMFLSSNKLRKPIVTSSRSYSFLDQFDPPYLKDLTPEIPEYDAVNIQIKGYDFAVLENYQSLIHRIAKTMDIEVEDW